MSKHESGNRLTCPAPCLSLAANQVRQDRGRAVPSCLASSAHCNTTSLTASGVMLSMHSQLGDVFSRQPGQEVGMHIVCARGPTGAHLPGCIGLVGGNSPSVRCPSAAERCRGPVPLAINPSARLIMMPSCSSVSFPHTLVTFGNCSNVVACSSSQRPSVALPVVHRWMPGCLRKMSASLVKWPIGHSRPWPFDLV